MSGLISPGAKEFKRLLSEQNRLGHQIAEKSCTQQELLENILGVLREMPGVADIAWRQDESVFAVTMQNGQVFGLDLNPLES